MVVYQQVMYFFEYDHLEDERHQENCQKRPVCEAFIHRK